MGYGGTRRARRAGRVRSRTLASRSHDSRDLGRNLEPPDSRWIGSDGTKAGSQNTFQSFGGRCVGQRTSGNGIGSPTSLGAAASRERSPGGSALQAACRFYRGQALTKVFAIEQARGKRPGYGKTPQRPHLLVNSIWVSFMLPVHV